MKNINTRKIEGLGKRAVRLAKQFALATVLTSTLWLPMRAKAEEKIEASKEPRTAISLHVGTGVDLFSKDPRATMELDVSHRLSMGFGLGVNFGIASTGSFNEGIQPRLQLEQMDVILSSPKFGPVALSVYMQNSTHLGTILAEGGNAVVDLGP
jgi:hypothetical protein